MSAAIQGIYVALFGRPADPGGLAYWTEVTKNGADLGEMLRVLPSLPEYTSRFDGMDNNQIVSSIYQSLFGRAPDAEGLAFFVEALASGSQSIATIAVHILNGAQGTDKADVDAKIDAAQQFTAALDTDEEIAAYDADAIEAARTFLNGVDRDNPATEESVNGAVEDIVTPDEGQAPGGGGGGGGGLLPAALVAINASAETDMLATLNKYAGDVFNDAAADLFDDLPEGQGRQQAIASGVYEQIQLFGKFKTLADIKATVTFHTETEHAKFLFINAIKAARESGDQTEMLAALELGKELSQDRQDLIAKWSDADAPQAAKDRAAALEEDSYTVELLELANASPVQLQVLAHAVLNAVGNFNGVGGTIAALATVDFSEIQQISGDFTIGNTDYAEIIVGTDANNDSIEITQEPSSYLYVEGVEYITNSRPSTGSEWSYVNLAGSKEVIEVSTDFSGATGYPALHYRAASTETKFVAENNNSREATLSIRFSDVTTESTIKLGLENNSKYQAFFFGDGISVDTVELSLAAGSAGSVSVRNVADNVVLTGEGGVTYITHSTALHNFDASTVQGNIKLQQGGDGGQINVTTPSTILTGAGADVIMVGKSTGNLTINAGAGNDTIWGGSGADTFVFDGENFGNDTIHDFVVGTDTLDLSDYDFADVAFAQVGADAVVTVGAAGTIKLIGVDAAALEASVYPA